MGRDYAADIDAMRGAVNDCNFDLHPFNDRVMRVWALTMLGLERAAEIRNGEDDRRETMNRIVRGMDKAEARDVGLGMAAVAFVAELESFLETRLPNGGLKPSANRAFDAWCKRVEAAFGMVIGEPERYYLERLLRRRNEFGHQGTVNANHPRPYELAAAEPKEVLAWAHATVRLVDLIMVAKPEP